MKIVPTVILGLAAVNGASAWAADTDRLDAVRAALASGDAITCPGCDLRGANLSLADLSDADLEGANLANSDLSGASLVGANLANASLIGANLISADLTDANLSGANLSRAFIRATRLCATVMPDGRRDDSGC